MTFMTHSAQLARCAQGKLTQSENAAWCSQILGVGGEVESVAVGAEVSPVKSNQV